MASLKTQNSKLKTKIRWLLKGLVAAFCLWLVFILTGRVLRPIAISQIAELTNTEVKAESVDFNLNGSVFIKNLIIRPYAEQKKYDDAILKAETVYVRFGIGSLLLLRPRLKEINVNDFIFSAQYNLDTGRWNVAELKIRAPKGGSGRIPVVHLKRGVLQYSEVSKAKVKVIAAVPLDAGLEPAEEMRDGYSFNITTAERAGLGKSTLTGYWQSGRVIVTGGVSSADIPAFERSWTINNLAAELNYDRNNTYSLKLKIKELFSRQEAADDRSVFDSRVLSGRLGLFDVLQKFFSRYRPAGRIDIDLRASGSLDRLSESALAGKVYCRDTSICYYKFPYTIEHIAGQIDFTEKGVVLNNLYGEHGNVELFFNGWSRGFGANCQYQIRITSDNMTLDDDLYNALSARQKRLWSDFSPSGLAAIDYRFSRQSQTDKKKTLAVELLGAEAVYRRFPYPLKNLTGTLVFDGDSVTVSDVVSGVNEREIILNGKVTECRTDRPVYDISIKANNILLDSTLAESLTAVQKHTYGQIDTGGLIRIGELTGRVWRGQEDKQACYHLSLYTEKTELSDSLFGLLPVSLGKVISKLQPAGEINWRVDLDKAENREQPDYKITVDCLGDSVDFESFGYPLKDITGRLTITKDSIKFADITAAVADSVRVTPETSTIRINGQIALADNALSSGWFRLSASNICFDERFGIALPDGVEPFYAQLSPAGRFDVSDVNVKIFGAADGGKYIDFAGAARLIGCNLNISPPITELNAGLRIKGLYKTGEGLCNGRAELVEGSLRVKGKLLTGLKANIDYDPSLRSWVAKDLVADCYGGKLVGKLELKRPTDKAWEYLLQTGFEDIDLSQFLREPGRTSLRSGTVSDTGPEEGLHNGHTSGKMSGSLSVAGQISDVLRIGRCRLTISDMQVGKLSPLAKLLHVLKLTEPKDFAFDRMFVDSYIKHNKLFFERFDLSGEALAFSGSGWMDLQSWNIDLLLTARGHRLATAEPSIWQSLAEGLGQGVVQMDVTGNVYDPQVVVRTLPVIEGTLQLLGTAR